MTPTEMDPSMSNLIALPRVASRFKLTSTSTSSWLRKGCPPPPAAEAAPTRDYTVFVHLLRPDGTCCAWQQDSMPQQNAYPTGRWISGEIVVDTYTIAPLPPGAYPLEIGLYLAETGQRLQVTATGQPEADVVLLPPLVTEQRE